MTDSLVKHHRSFPKRIRRYLHVKFMGHPEYRSLKAPVRRTVLTICENSFYASDVTQLRDYQVPIINGLLSHLGEALRSEIQAQQSQLEDSEEDNSHLCAFKYIAKKKPDLLLNVMAFIARTAEDD